MYSLKKKLKVYYLYFIPGDLKLRFGKAEKAKPLRSKNLQQSGRGKIKNIG